VQLTLEQYESINPVAAVDDGGVRMLFSTPGVLTLQRVQTIREKEPWTLEWIAGFREGDVLVDVGANVGMYTVWAAMTRQARVIAFEPESQNYALLNRNIALNGIADRVTAYCMGLADRGGLSTLHMADLRAGASCHSVGEALDFRHEPMPVRFTQGCVAATLDDLVASGAVPMATHIKVDVDGFEPKVIAGARATLADARLKSLLVETNRNLADHLEMVAVIEAAGFRFDPAQVARAERKSGAFKGVAEHVFQR
jgi:FkbM family methyltransferase